LKIESAYLLAGPEAGKRAAFVAELRGAIAAKDGAPPEEHRLYASEAGLGELLAVLRNGSLFASRRLVEYRGAEAVKGKEDIGALAAYLAAPAPDAVLVLTTELFYAERALEEAVGKDRKRTFYEMFENEKPRWIKNRLAGSGLRIDDEGVAALLELVENESAALDSACTRLAAVFPAGAEIGEAQVEAAIAHSRQEDAFSLFARVAAGELEDALEVLEAVLADRRGDAVQIVSALIWSFRRLHRLGLLVEGGESFESACLRLQIRSKTLQRQCAAALRRYSGPERERIIRLASDFDCRARALGAAFERGLLQLLVFGIMARKGELDLGIPAQG
jgi:DNA polymerase III subunit delta